MVDEKALENTINGLREKLSSMEGEVAEARQTLSGLFSIQKTPDGKNPIDGGTGVEMTDERREKVYSNCKPRAEAVINTN